MPKNGPDAPVRRRGKAGQDNGGCRSLRPPERVPGLAAGDAARGAGAEPAAPAGGPRQHPAAGSCLLPRHPGAGRRPGPERAWPWRGWPRAGRRLDRRRRHGRWPGPAAVVPGSTRPVLHLHAAARRGPADPGIRTVPPAPPPGYAGLLLAWVVAGLATANWAVALALALLMVVAYRYLDLQQHPVMTTPARRVRRVLALV